MFLIFLFSFHFYGGWSSKNAMKPACTDYESQKKVTESAFVAESSTKWAANATSTTIATWIGTKFSHATPSPSTLSTRFSTPSTILRPVSLSPDTAPIVAGHAVATHEMKDGPELEKMIIPLIADDSRAIVMAKQQREDTRWIQTRAPRVSQACH